MIGFVLCLENLNFPVLITKIYIPSLNPVMH